MKKVLTVCVILLFLFAIACGEPAVVPQQDVAASPAPTAEPVDEPDVVVIATMSPTEIPTLPPTEAPTPEPTPAPTPEPTPTPAPTRAPKEGDICPNFPDYDTGVDADYSYQSDELRIAITVHQEKLADVKQNRELNETYYVVDIWVRNIHSMHTAFGYGEFNKHTEYGQDLAIRENAILATNGSQNQGLIIYEGKVLQGLRKNKGWNSGSVGLFYQDGSFKTFDLDKESFNPNKEIENGALFGWQFGPILIRDGEQGPNAIKYGSLGGYKARNMLGYYEPGHYVIVYCDNNGETSQGMNEAMMIDLMKSLNVKDAFNLDGGTSTVLVFMGKVINRPTTETKNGVTVYGRPLTDMFIFGECGEDGAFVDLSTLDAKTKDAE